MPDQAGKTRSARLRRAHMVITQTVNFHVRYAHGSSSTGMNVVPATLIQLLAKRSVYPAKFGKILFVPHFGTPTASHSCPPICTPHPGGLLRLRLRRFYAITFDDLFIELVAEPGTPRHFNPTQRIRHKGGYE
jgi:hypothetical protein